MKKFIIVLCAFALIVTTVTSCVGNTSSNYNSSQPFSETSYVSISSVQGSISTASSKTNSLPTSSLSENNETYNLNFYVSLMSMGIENWFISTADTENWVPINLTTYCGYSEFHEMRAIKSVSINYPYDFDETTVWKIKIIIDDSQEENPVSPTYMINDIIIKGTDPLIQVDRISRNDYTAICGQLERCDKCGSEYTVR